MMSEYEWIDPSRLIRKEDLVPEPLKVFEAVDMVVSEDFMNDTFELNLTANTSCFRRKKGS